MTWHDALSAPPTKPAVSNGVPLPNDPTLLVLGGWTDPAPTQVLKDIGCERVFMVNRPGGVGAFPLDIY